MKILMTVALFMAISYMPFTSQAASPFPSGLDVATTNDLIIMCNSNSSTYAAYCNGFVSGFLLNIKYQNLATKTDTETHNPCLPEEISAFQAQKMVEKFGSDHPDLLHIQAFMTLNNVLQEAFPPCVVTKE